MLGIETHPEIILKEPVRLMHAFFILCGFRVMQIFIDMIWYDIKLYKYAGEDYLRYGKHYPIRLYIMMKKYQKMRSTGNIGIKR